MTMQDNINIIGRNLRRNVHEPKLQTFALEIDNQRPVSVPIAISAHDRERRTDRFQIERDRRLAHIAQMPDLIGFARKIDNSRRQLVMSVGDNEHAHCFQQSAP